MLWVCGRVLASSKVWWTSVKSSSVCGVTTGAGLGSDGREWTGWVNRSGWLSNAERGRARRVRTQTEASSFCLAPQRLCGLIGEGVALMRRRVWVRVPAQAFWTEKKISNFENSAIAARTKRRRLSTQPQGLPAGCLQQSTKHIVDTGFAHGQNRRVSGALPSNIRVTGNARGAERNAINTKTPARESGTRHKAPCFCLIRASSVFHTSSRAAGSGTTGAGRAA